MEKKLDIDNPFFEYMGRVADVVLLNVLFIIGSLPIFTIGMTSTAMYSVVFKLVRREEVSVVREFIKVCKKEWKQSTKIWCMLLFTGIILLVDILYVSQLNQAGIWRMMGIVVGILTGLWVILFSYVFPVLAQFDNTTKNTIKNAFIMAIRHLPYTVLILILNSIPVVCLLLGAYFTGLIVPIYLFAGFATVAFINGMILNRVFKIYI